MSSPGAALTSCLRLAPRSRSFQENLKSLRSFRPHRSFLLEDKIMSNGTATNPDIVLIGAGIMSSTLGVFLKELDPSISIVMLETLEGPGRESSEAWNNAGTGHAANCEMNYTPERADGSI